MLKHPYLKSDLQDASSVKRETDTVKYRSMTIFRQNKNPQITFGLFGKIYMATLTVWFLKCGTGYRKLTSDLWLTVVY